MNSILTHLLAAIAGCSVGIAVIGMALMTKRAGPADNPNTEGEQGLVMPRLNDSALQELGK